MKSEIYKNYSTEINIFQLTFEINVISHCFKGKAKGYEHPNP